MCILTVNVGGGKLCHESVSAGVAETWGLNYLSGASISERFQVVSRATWHQQHNDDIKKHTSQLVPMP